MKKKYLLKFFINILITCAIIAGLSGLAYSQSVTIGTSSGYAPIEKNIAPGSTNNRIALFTIYSSTNVTITSITLPTAGTVTASDIAANGFKLWYANSFVTGDPIPSSTLIAQAPAVSAGGDIVFSGLNLAIPGGSAMKLLHITLDLEPGAVMGKTINVEEVNGFDFVPSSGSVSGFAAAQKVQTVGTPLPVIDINPNSIAAKNVSAGTTGLRIYGFSMEVQDADAQLNSITVPTKGTYATSDIQSNGISLWHVKNGGTTLVKSISAVVSGGNLVFSTLNELIEKDTYHYFYITADLSDVAVSGHTFGIDQFSKSNLDFAPYQVLDAPDPFAAGSLYTVAVPDVLIASSTIAASTVSPGSDLNVLYKLKVSVANSGAAFSQMKFTTGGTYQASDIVSGGFKLFIGDSHDFNPDEPIATENPVSSGSELTFNLNGASVEEDDQVYVYLTADLSNTAVNGRTIFIQGITASNVSVVSGNVSGSGSSSGIKSIVYPGISFSSASHADKTISAGTYVVLHTTQLNVTGAPVTFEGASFNLSGTYQTTDFSNTHTVELYYHTTTDLFEEWNSGNSVYSVSRVTNLPASGGTLTFNHIPMELYGANPNIPAGTGYLSVVVKMNDAAVSGHTIQASSIGLGTYAFASGIKSGTVGDGGVQTVGIPDIVVSGVTTPAGNISPGSDVVAYKIQLDVTHTGAILKKLFLTADGDYTSSDIYGFNFYLSEDLQFDEDEDIYTGYGNFATPGNQMSSWIYQNELPVGTTYLLIVASTSPYATMGKSVHISSTPVSAMEFISGNVSGSNIASGGTLTFAAPNAVNVSYSAVSGGKIQSGTRDNVIYKFALTPEGASALFKKITFTASGSFSSSDVEEYDAFHLSYSASNSFSESSYLSSADGISSGEQLVFDYLEHTIPDGTTHYFFVTVNLPGNAANGSTIYLNAVNETDFEFSAGTAAGSGPAGETFEIEYVVSGLFGKEYVSETEIFPNPCRTNSVVKIVSKTSDEMKVTIYDASANLIRSMEETGKEIYLSDLESGFYMVTIQNLRTGIQESKRLIVE